ncbi:two-component regulator propeller domain-containing protein [Wenyingzhuangia sp.]|uniref:type IX secretion system anionic LPS delivery protein PorZ n=1 Tax=Wenyingzhuangia sp. TaxID=1964193 RepID=UPI00321A69C1
MMKYIYLYLLMFIQVVFGQTDYTDQWRDFYSYNNVKDFVIGESRLYAISNNAMFTYDTETKKTQKFSSVNGLSGTTTSSISFDEYSGNIIIGYENGLIEIISQEHNVYPITGIRDNLILVNKIVNGVYSHQKQSYVYGDFGIVQLDVEKLEFGDTYKLSNTGNASVVNEMVYHDDMLYVGTTNGLYKIDLSLNPVDIENWDLVTSGNITNLLNLGDEVYFTKGSSVFKSANPASAIITESQNILEINKQKTTNDLMVTLSNKIVLYENELFTKTNQIVFADAQDYSFTTTKAIVYEENLFVNTSEFGVLKTTLTDKVNYTEIHPNGPSANDVFSISIAEDQVWVTYGGHNLTYNGLNKYRGVDCLVDGEWQYLSNNEIGSKKDYLKVLIDPFDNSKTLIASLRDGVTELVDFKFVNRWERENTYNILPGHLSVGEAFVGNMIVDNNNIIWTANSRAKDNLFFSSYNGAKTGADRWESSIPFPDIEGSEGIVRGFNKMSVDQNNNVFAATARTGIFAFDANPIENETDRNIAILDNSAHQGQLPSNYVYAVVSDENNRIWIGTALGLVVFDDYENLFKETKRPVKTLIIEENGVAREFLGDIQVNDIIIDLAGNKWFATQGAGVIQTSSDAQTTYNIFNTSNSPLPEDIVIDLELDKTTGEIYMVTNKGVLSYDSKNEPFGSNITPVIGYPNPAIKNKPGHEIITIVAKDGNGIPEGTNVKIIDMSGKLVYEKNVNSYSGNFGGKVVWDKTNLRGNTVVSGIYVVLLSSADGSETTSTKIAIVN